MELAAKPLQQNLHLGCQVGSLSLSLFLLSLVLFIGASRRMEHQTAEEAPGHFLSGGIKGKMKVKIQVGSSPRLLNRTKAAISSGVLPVFLHPTESLHGPHHTAVGICPITRSLYIYEALLCLSTPPRSLLRISLCMPKCGSGLLELRG